MGSIRQQYIKKAAKTLLHHYPDEFTTDFETNKRLVEQYTDLRAKKLRNRIAGYLVRLVKIQMANARAEAAQGGEEVIGDMEM